MPTLDTDEIKKAVAQTVQEFMVDELFQDEIWERLPMDAIKAVEVTKISPLESSVRIFPESGAPRYFLIKVSEQL